VITTQRSRAAGPQVVEDIDAQAIGQTHVGDNDVKALCLQQLPQSILQAARVSTR
jgi:hypothetical protein